MSEKKQIICNILKVLQEEVTQHSTKRLRVVEWQVDGKGYVMLEKRETFPDPVTGAERMGKNKGLNLKDLQFITENWLDILELFAPKEVDESPI